MVFLIGALIPTYLLSRLFLLIMKKWDGGWQKVVFANLVSLLAATFLGAIGMADSGAFAAAKAFSGYALPQCVWAAYDLFKLRAAKQKLPS
jgi:hypothetical protein